ncbi:SIR2 family protein [Alkalibacillus silvisoli]|uniref:NAD(+) hydrolase ThsA n=1 Tax=Alkalibacillus silvisoli TaxID=392823 RepID=A0ABP3JLX2_9BACI
MTFNSDINKFIDEYVNALKEGSAAIFAGAGLSMPSGAVDWKSLLKEPARTLGLDVEKESDLVGIAQYIYNDTGTKTRLSELIKDNFGELERLNDNHYILSKLPIKTYWTTNYDRLIEQSLKRAGKRADVKKRVTDLSMIEAKRDAIVYKMHGDVDVANEAVLTKDDYELYETKNEMFTVALKGDLISKTFAFVGFSFEDPNLEHILSKVRVLMDGHTRQHYCFIKRVKECDYGECAEEKERYRYEKIRQELKCADLKRYSIKPLIIEEYEEIMKIFEEITIRYTRNHAFISGSAHEFDEFEVEGVDPEEFIHTLSKSLHQEDLVLATGFGERVGSGVINGVLEGMSERKTRNLNEHIIMRPFPQFSSLNKSKEDLWTEYRHDLLSECGIGIFIFGNKESSEFNKNEIVYSDGLEEEFDIALDQSVKVVPVGVTGYASRDLWERVVYDFDTYYPEFPELREKFMQLGEDGINYKTLIDTVLDIVREIRRSK